MLARLPRLLLYDRRANPGDSFRIGDDLKVAAFKVVDQDLCTGIGRASASCHDASNRRQHPQEIHGSEAFRGFINKHAGASIAPEGAEKLYISRSTLPRDRGSILGEYKLEEYLRAEGYDIFHPQRATPEEQIARYKAARLIIAEDCSPVHLLGYVGNSSQNVAVVLRRSMAIGAYLSRQLQVFKGMQATEIECLLDDWIPMPGKRPSRSSWGEIDFGRLQAALLASGHITGTTPWPSLTEDERAAELERVGKMHETTMESFKEIQAKRQAKAARDVEAQARRDAKVGNNASG